MQRIEPMHAQNPPEVSENGPCSCGAAFQIQFARRTRANPAPVIPYSQNVPPSLSDSATQRQYHAYLALPDGRLGSMHTRHDQWER